MSYFNDQQDLFEQFSQIQDPLLDAPFDDWSFLQEDLVESNSELTTPTTEIINMNMPTTTPPLSLQQHQYHHQQQQQHQYQQQQQQQQQQQHLQLPTTPGTPKAPGSTMLPTNQINGNSNNVTMTNNNNSNSTSNNNCATTPEVPALHSPLPQQMKKKEEVDHHKRLNELQARFRVNYTRKPNPIKSESEMGIVIMSQEKEKVVNRSLPIQIQRVSRPNNHPVDAETHQRQLDDQLEHLDMEDVTVAELKEMLRQRGKQATGKKAVLLSRLLEEKKNVKGRNRLSQPTMVNQNRPNFSDRRPHSFQSPMKIQLPGPPDFSVSAPGSPGSPFYRSIANMQISSPPARRYSPYSPRLSSPDSGMNQWDHHNHNNNNLISPGGRRLHTASGTSQKSYKPFTSSTLATPDREEEVNPFDIYYAQTQEEEKVDWNDVESLLKQASQQDPLTNDDLIAVLNENQSLLDSSLFDLATHQYHHQHNHHQ